MKQIMKQKMSKNQTFYQAKMNLNQSNRVNVTSANQPRRVTTPNTAAAQRQPSPLNVSGKRLWDFCWLKYNSSTSLFILNDTVVDWRFFASRGHGLLAVGRVHLWQIEKAFLYNLLTKLFAHKTFKHSTLPITKVVRRVRVIGVGSPRTSLFHFGGFLKAVLN